MVRGADFAWNRVQSDRAPKRAVKSLHDQTQFCARRHHKVIIMDEKRTGKRLSAASCRYLSEDELAERWGINKRTLQGHRQSGPKTGVDTLAFSYLGGCVRYRKRDIYAFERAGKRISTSDPGPDTTDA